MNTTIMEPLKCTDENSHIGITGNSWANWAACPARIYVPPLSVCAGSHTQNISSYLSENTPKIIAESRWVTRVCQHTYTWQHEHPVEPNEAGWGLLGHVGCDSDKHWHGGHEIHDTQEAYHVRPTVLGYQQLEEVVEREIHGEKYLVCTGTASAREAVHANEECEEKYECVVA